MRKLSNDELKIIKNIQKSINGVKIPVAIYARKSSISEIDKQKTDIEASIETKQQRDQFFKDTFEKITITNEIIKCYIPYDRFTDKITGIELVLNEIARELLMKNGFKYTINT